MFDDFELIERIRAQVARDIRESDADRCARCSGEDCACCEIFTERNAPLWENDYWM